MAKQRISAGQVLKDMRDGAGYTQNELAARAKVSPSIIQKYEGAEPIERTRPTLRKILEAMGRTLGEYDAAMKTGVVSDTAPPGDFDLARLSKEYQMDGAEIVDNMVRWIWRQTEETRKRAVGASLSDSTPIETQKSRRSN